MSCRSFFYFSLGSPFFEIKHRIQSIEFEKISMLSIWRTWSAVGVYATRIASLQTRRSCVFSEFSCIGWHIEDHSMIPHFYIISVFCSLWDVRIIHKED